MHDAGNESLCDDTTGSYLSGLVLHQSGCYTHGPTPSQHVGSVAWSMRQASRPTPRWATAGVSRTLATAGPLLGCGARWPLLGWHTRGPVSCQSAHHAPFRPRPLPPRHLTTCAGLWLPSFCTTCSRGYHQHLLSCTGGGGVAPSALVASTTHQAGSSWHQTSSRGREQQVPGRRQRVVLILMHPHHHLAPRHRGGGEGGREGRRLAEDHASRGGGGGILS